MNRKRINYIERKLCLDLNEWMLVNLIIALAALLQAS